MTRDILVRTFERVFEHPNLANHFTVFWHGGEPLSAPLDFYDFAFQTAQRLKPPTCSVDFGFQTNSTLLNEDWCAFLSQTQSRIGLSIDGPDFIHNQQRRYRSGKGTHAAVMRAVALLKKNQIPFRVTSVITNQSLGYAGEIYDFIKGIGCESWGFNIEELQGVNHRRSFEFSVSDGAIRQFIRDLFCLWFRDRDRVRIREFDGLISKMAMSNEGQAMQVAQPFAIINVDVEGYFSTFSPELLGCETQHGKFVFGNVLVDDFKSAVQNETYRKINGEIASGIEACQQSCEYFNLCGGGSPASKFFEFGRFDVTETRSCQTRIKLLIDEVLSALEGRFLRLPVSSLARTISEC